MSADGLRAYVAAKTSMWGNRWVSSDQQMSMRGAHKYSAFLVMRSVRVIVQKRWNELGLTVMRLDVSSEFLGGHERFCAALVLTAIWFCS